MEINITCLDTDAFNLSLSVYPTDTVQYIKRIVYEKFQFPFDKQTLTFDSHNALEDDRNLLHYNIQANDSIQLVYQMQLFVKTFADTKTLNVPVSSNVTVESVKARVYALCGITDISSLDPSDQKLFFNEVRLDSWRAFSFYSHVRDGSTLHLGRVDRVPTITFSIYGSNIHLKNTTFRAKPDHRVYDIMATIQKSEGIDTHDVRLFLNFRWRMAT